MPGRIDDPMAWRSLADADLSRARRRLGEEDFSDGLVHLQQAAEKYLKAWLVGLGMDVAQDPRPASHGRKLARIRP